MKQGETLCRRDHPEEWADGRVNPCAWCYIAESEAASSALRAVAVATADG